MASRAAALGLLLLILLAAPVAAQQGITARATAEEAPDHPRRLLLTVEAASSGPPLVEARLFIQPIGAPARVGRVVPVDPATTLRLTESYSLFENAVPPGTTVETFWRLTDAEGNRVETPPQQSLVLDPLYDWKTIEDARVAIHYYQGERVWGEAMFETAQRALAQLEEELGATITRKIRLVIYRDQRDFRAAFPPLQEWIGGRAFPRLGVTVQVIAAGEAEWMQTVIFHEISHLVFQQALEGALVPPPTWLEEGLAMFNEPDTLRDRDSHEEVAAAALNDQLIPYSGLQGNFGADGRTVNIAYAQSELMVEYLLESCGTDGFQEMIDLLVDEDRTVDEGLTDACGYDSQELYTRWRAQQPDPLPPPPFPATLAALTVSGACLSALLFILTIVAIYRVNWKPEPPEPPPYPLDGEWESGE